MFKKQKFSSDKSYTKKEFSFDNEKDREEAVHFVQHLKEIMLKKIETVTHSLQNIGTISSLFEVENLLQNFEVIVVLVYSAKNDNNFYQIFTEIKRSFANALFATLDVDGVSGDKKKRLRSDALYKSVRCKLEDYLLFGY